MSGNHAKRHPGIKPLHPGELLREDVIPALGRSKTEIARLLAISRQALYDILNEKGPITAEMAVKLGKLCGNGPTLWLKSPARLRLVARAAARGRFPHPEAAGGGIAGSRKHDCIDCNVIMS